jgi:hypothetical protein
VFSKDEKKAFKQLFWTSFGKFMSKHESVSGQKVNWSNYKTRIKDLYVRLEVDTKKASFAIEFQHTDEGIRQLFFDQFKELKTVFHSIMGDNLEWIQVDEQQHKIISKICADLPGVNIYNKNTWEDAFPFFEKHMVNFDEFWSEFSELFVILQD